MTLTFRTRRTIMVFVSLILMTFIINSSTPGKVKSAVTKKITVTNFNLAVDALNKLEIKGRTPKTDYTRQQFGADWLVKNGCDTRNIILHRDLIDAVVDESCNVTSGTLNDPYTGKTIEFKRGSSTSSVVQIDHVVALSDAWQKGAQQWTQAQRIVLANDPLELLAVDGAANLEKSDGDAATWLPSNKSFRCEYVARQIAVKQKYKLWMTSAEHDAIALILTKCPNQLLPSP